MTSRTAARITTALIIAGITELPEKKAVRTPADRNRMNRITDLRITKHRITERRITEHRTAGGRTTAALITAETAKIHPRGNFFGKKSFREVNFPVIKM